MNSLYLIIVLQKMWFLSLLIKVIWFYDFFLFKNKIKLKNCYDW